MSWILFIIASVLPYKSILLPLHEVHHGYDTLNWNSFCWSPTNSSLLEKYLVIYLFDVKQDPETEGNILLSPRQDIQGCVSWLQFDEGIKGGFHVRDPEIMHSLARAGLSLSWEFHQDFKHSSILKMMGNFQQFLSLSKLYLGINSVPRNSEK